MALISCQNLRIAYGGHPLLDDAMLTIERGERIGLVGRNGEGKTTLLRIVDGAESPDEGTVVRASGVRWASLAQTVPEHPGRTVAQVIASGLPGPEPGDHPVERMCSLMDLDPTHLFAEQSGGQKRRALLGQALVGDPDLLILDEPTNHLDIASILWLESYLARFAGSLLFVTHDRAFLQRLATRILELDRGRLTSWDCDYPTYLRRKDEQLAAEEEQWAQFDKKLAQEEAWIRQGIKARRTRNEGRVRALNRLRAERSARRERSGTVRMSVQAGDRSGVKVIRADDVDFAYGDLPILRGFSTEIQRGDKVGIIGANGCGKTTLLNLLLGRQQPQRGSILHGTTLQIAYFDQHRHQLDASQTVFESVADGNDQVTIDGKRRHVMSYLQDFLFSPDRARQPVHSLSGGERNRLLLARLFTRLANVLVLDEPTNDLDTETLEMLEARLVEFAGTVLVVSHDRQFLDEICSSTLVFEGPGDVNEYVGGYSDWQRVMSGREKPAAKPRTTREPIAAPAPATRKLSNREREEWCRLGATIEALEAELVRLGEDMADPVFFKQDPEGARRAGERARALPEEIEAAFERWAELDERA